MKFLEKSENPVTDREMGEIQSILPEIDALFLVLRKGQEVGEGGVCNFLEINSYFSSSVNYGKAGLGFGG